MHQAEAVHFAPSPATDHFVTLVYDIEDFFRHEKKWVGGLLDWWSMGKWESRNLLNTAVSKGFGDSDEIVEAHRLSAGLVGDAGS